MLRIVDYDEKIMCRQLTHGDDVFHKALRAVANNEEKRFHVMRENGEFYDLEYKRNMDFVTHNIPLSEGVTLCPPYLLYDENDFSRLYLDMFETYDGAIFEHLDEYSIVLTKIILKYTSKDIYVNDQRFLWFVEPDKRLHIVDEVPDFKEVNCFSCVDQIRYGYVVNDLRVTWSVGLFHDIFFIQNLSDLPISKIKYAEMVMGSSTGIGGLLAMYTRFTNAFHKLGIKVVLRRKGTTFDDDMLKRCFNLDFAPEDMDETNSLFVPAIAPLAATYFIAARSADFDQSILNDSFRKEMDEYTEAVIGDKRMLAVLIRGTDYITSKMPGVRMQAKVDDMLPLIRQWMEEDKYDGIFLLTEDRDVLDLMKKEFPGKIRAIAQERFGVEDFEKTKTSLILDLQKKEKTEQEFKTTLEDTTVNYFYGLWAAAHCESFIASGMANGFDVTRSFNGGKFKKVHLFKVWEK